MMSQRMSQVDNEEELVEAFKVRAITLLCKGPDNNYGEGKGYKMGKLQARTILYPLEDEIKLAVLLFKGVVCPNLK